MGQVRILLALGILQLLFVTARSRMELSLFPLTISAPRSVGASGCQECGITPEARRWFLVVLGTSSCTSPSGKHTQSQGNFSRVDGSPLDRLRRHSSARESRATPVSGIGCYGAACTDGRGCARCISIIYGIRAALTQSAPSPLLALPISVLGSTLPLGAFMPSLL